MRHLALAASLSAALTLVTASTSFAQDYPSRLITFLVPFAAGTATDTVARFLAEGVSKRLKQTVIVENKAGANGMIGARALVGGTSDGYTVFITTSSTHAANANLYNELGYDPVKDFAPVARLAEIPLAIVVGADLPVNTLPDLMKLAKTKTLSYASGNTSGLIGAELIAYAAKAKMVRVPYANNTQGILDVITGRVDMMAADMTIALPQIEAKKLKALAVTSTTRIRQLPDTPTVKEAGYPETGLIGWWAAFVKAGTPPAIVSKLNATLVDVINSKEGEEFLARNGAKPYASTPEQLRDFVVSETASWAKFVEIAGIEKQ